MDYTVKEKPLVLQSIRENSHFSHDCSFTRSNSEPHNDNFSGSMFINVHLLIIIKYNKIWIFFYKNIGYMEGFEEQSGCEGLNNKGRRWGIVKINTYYLWNMDNYIGKNQRILIIFKYQWRHSEVVGIF